MYKLSNAQTAVPQPAIFHYFAKAFNFQCLRNESKVQKNQNKPKPNTFM